MVFPDDDMAVLDHCWKLAGKIPSTKSVGLVVPFCQMSEHTGRVEVRKLVEIQDTGQSKVCANGSRATGVNKRYDIGEQIYNQ